MNNIHQINYSSFSLLAIIRQILCNLYLFIIHLAIRNRHIRGGLRVESVLLKPVTKFLLILETAPTRTSSHVVQVPSNQRYWWGLVVIMSAFSLSYITQRSGPRSSLPISHLVAPSCCICPWWSHASRLAQGAPQLGKGGLYLLLCLPRAGCCWLRWLLSGKWARLNF